MFNEERKIIHVVVNTHWDREWVYPFEETRLLLVDFMDALLDLLEKDKELKYFTMDSQTVCIEDYLELRPENRGRIEKLVKEGRLLIGPWYTLPEEFIVNGESLVRNLLIGHKVASSFGRVFKVGYTPFSYGQTSQMPQIYNGFGIDTIIFYRGINTPKSEFIFIGPDGSKLLGMRFGCLSRFSYYIYIYRVLRYGSDDVYAFYDWDRGAGPFRLASVSRPRAHYYITDPSHKMWNVKPIKEQLKKLITDESKHFTTPHICCMEGFDSSSPDEKESEILRLCQEIMPEHEFRFSNLEDYMNELKKVVKEPCIIRGESRDPGATGKWTHLMGDVISARVRVKQANHKAELILQRGAEPWSAIANLLGKEYFRRAFERAWKLLLQNHPHDTITGGGVDQIEKDALNRADQVSIISDGLMRRALQYIFSQINLASVPVRESVLILFNPSPFARSDVLSTYIDLPEKMGYECCELVELETGQSVPMVVQQEFEFGNLVRNLQDISIELRSKRLLTHILAEDIPPMGYKTYHIKPSEAYPGLEGDNIFKNPFTLENEYMIVTINGDGTFNLTHKESGKTYTNLHYFEDTGETGHSWIHMEPDENETIYSLGVPATITVEVNNPLLARVRIDYKISIPVGLEREINELDREAEKNHTRRSKERVPLEISSWLTLKRSSRILEVSTKVINRSKNHRLRVVFPTGLSNASYSNAEVAFDVVSRPIKITKESPYYGKPNPQYPMYRFVDLSDGENGFAVINNSGLREYEVPDEPSRPIAITLFRAFTFRNAPIFGRWDVYPEMELSQCLGELNFSYAIYPHRGDWKNGVIWESEKFNIPIEPTQAGPLYRGSLPTKLSFLEIESGLLQLTALKMSEEKDKTLVVRFYNPSEEEVDTCIKFFAQPLRVDIVNMEEKPIKSLPIDNRKVRLKVGTKKIITLRVEF